MSNKQNKYNFHSTKNQLSKKQNQIINENENDKINSPLSSTIISNSEFDHQEPDIDSILNNDKDFFTILESSSDLLFILFE